MSGPDTDHAGCRLKDSCPVYRAPSERQFCPDNELQCQELSGLPGALERYKHVRPSDSVELKLGLNFLRLHRIRAHIDRDTSKTHPSGI